MLLPTSRPRVYLAGPDVFLKDPLAIAKAKKTICRKYGMEGVFPMDNVLNLKGLLLQEQGMAISRSNEQLMRSCDTVIANMTPFRGPSMDVGTAYEMGFMRSLGKPVFAYTNVISNFFTRIAAFVQQFFNEKIRKVSTHRYEDPQGMEVEDFNLTDNLMLDGAVVQSGGKIFRENVPEKELYTSLKAFEKAVRLAAQKLSTTTIFHKGDLKTHR